MQSIVTVLSFGWPYLRRYGFRLFAGVLLGVFFGLSNSSFVWASRTLTERFQPSPPAPAPEARAGANPLASTVRAVGQGLQEAIDPWLPRVGMKLTWRQMVGGLLFLPLLVATRAIFDYLSNYCMGWVSERMNRDLRVDIMRKLGSLSMDFFTRSTTGDLLTRMNLDSLNLQRCLRIGGADLIKESVTVVAVFAGLCWLDWKLTVCALGLLPVCLLPLYLLGRKTRRAAQVIRRAAIAQSSQLVEMMQHIRVIKAFNLETEQLRVFLDSSKRMLHASMKAVQAKEAVNPLVEMIGVFGLGGVLIYIFASGRSGSDLVGFLTGLTLFFIPLRKLASVHILFEQAGVGVERIVQFLQEQPTVLEPARPKPLPAFQSEIRFERVSFAYRDRHVVRDFDLVVPRGCRLGLAGESGSGKSTIVNLLFRFYDPSAGAVMIDQVDLREVSTVALRQHLALVSQDVVLFDSTVAENIGCGKPGATRPEIEEAARAASAHEFIRQLPQGYDSPVGERGVTLSGGQRQRIAIARAFVRNAPILVLDEATASLDAKAEAEVQAAIDRLAEHRTVICIAHRLATLARMDRIIVMDEGRIIEHGAFDALLRARGPFATMAARQGLVAR